MVLLATLALALQLPWLSLVLAAVLKSVFGLCLGCRAFALLMRAGVIPAEVCERCSDIWAAPASRI